MDRPGALALIRLGWMRTVGCVVSPYQTKATCTRPIARSGQCRCEYAREVSRGRNAKRTSWASPGIGTSDSAVAHVGLCRPESTQV